MLSHVEEDGIGGGGGGAVLVLNDVVVFTAPEEYYNAVGILLQVAGLTQV